MFCCTDVSGRAGVLSMELNDALDRLLVSYRRYYDIERDHPTPPFAAEAVFSLHDEGYVLLRSAKIAEQDCREYVFFALLPLLDEGEARRLSELAWAECLRRTEPGEHHRSTEAQLVILCQGMTEEAARLVRRTNPYKSYRLGLRGWSSMKWIACDIETGRAVWNRRGGDLRRVVCAQVRQGS